MKRLVLLASMLTLGGPLAHAADPPRAVPGVRYVYLIRHGMYDRDDHADDRVGNGLNALGREQALLIGARLANLPVRMTSLVSSDYTRARETAGVIGRALGMTPALDSLLHECTPSSARPDSVGRSAHEEAAACEANLAAVWARYVRPAAARDEHVVLVCHGNVIRWLVSRSLAMDPRRWTSMEIANASLTVIAVRPDGSTRLVLFSDVGHLPVPKQTWTGRGAGWGSAPAPSGRMGP
jgi:serine/threonine-protein phosphatase PGAM5